MRTKPRMLSSLLQEYFGDFMIRQRRLSPNTVAAYRDSWCLFLRFLQRTLRWKPSEITVDALTASGVLKFLDSCEKERANSPHTRNARLAAIRSAVHFALARDPTLSPEVHQIVKIPSKKTPQRVMSHLEPDEVRALLAATDSGTWSGRRDRVLLEVMYNTGARVSELSQARINDVIFEKPGRLLLHGKGRKERVIPLWGQTVRLLREWIRSNRLCGEDPLFPNTHRGFISRSGVEKRLAGVLKTAIRACPSMARHAVTPHTLRHTTAMHLLESGVDLSMIGLWLGHESIETTNKYLTSSLDLKRKALATLQEPDVAHRRFKADDSLMTFLKTLDADTRL